MGKKVLVISTSLRHNSNSEKLARSFAEGAKAAGNEVEIVSLTGKTIAFCKGCFEEWCGNPLPSSGDPEHAR